MPRQKAPSEISTEDVFTLYQQLGFQSQIALFKLIKADLEQQAEMVRVKSESLEEIVPRNTVSG